MLNAIPVLKADKVMIAGDWHSNRLWADYCIRQANVHGIDLILQLGDFGIWPHHGKARPAKLQLSKSTADLFPFAMVVEASATIGGVTVAVVPGNHEDYDQIAAIPTTDQNDGWGQVQHFSDHLIFLPRGYRFAIETHDGVHQTSFIAVGGAPSIDFEWREEGTSWWPGEALTEADVKKITSAAKTLPGPDVFLSHDAPEPLTPKIQRIVNNPGGWSEAGLLYADEGRERITRIFNAVKPKFLFHGHYHVQDSADLTGGIGHNAPFKFHAESLNMDGTDGNLIIFDIATHQIQYLGL